MRRIKKLRYRLAAVVTLLIMSTLIAVVTITHHRAVSVIRKQSVELNMHLVESGVEKLDSSHSQFNSLFQSIYLNDRFESFLRSQARGISGQSFQDAAVLNSVFLSVLSSRSDLYSIIFVDTAGRVFYATRNETGFYSDYNTCGFSDAYLKSVENAIDWDLGIQMLPTDRHLPLRNRWSEIPYVYAAARKIINVQNRFEPVGVMFITVNLNDLERLANLVKPDTAATTYISDSRGRIIFDSSGNRIGELLPNEMVDKLEEKAMQNAVLVDHEPCIMVSAKASETDWYVLTVIPESVYMSDALHVSSSIMITAIIAIFAAFIVTTIFSYAISKPIEELASAMAQSHPQDLNYRVDVRGADEIAQLGHSFNNLMDRLETAIYNEYMMSLRQKDATIQALQAQLNPHFLYNTLQSISGIALVNGVPEIDEIALALGDNLRYTVKGDDVLATVREEITHVRNYLFIQKIRFGERLNFMIDIPEYIMEYLLPRVSIQPMVENAIIHGLEHREEPGNIAIRGWMEESAIVIEVSDDGKGIAEEQLAKIRRSLDDYDEMPVGSTEHGIGISNLNARLKLLYERQGSMTIESAPDIGTVVRIEVDAIKRGTESCIGS